MGVLYTAVPQEWQDTNLCTGTLSVIDVHMGHTPRRAYDKMVDTRREKREGQRSVDVFGG